MTTSVRLDSKTEQLLDRLATKTGRTRSYYIREALERELPRLAWEYDLLQEVHDVRVGKVPTYSLDEVSAELGLDDWIFSDCQKAVKENR